MATRSLPALILSATLLTATLFADRHPGATDMAGARPDVVASWHALAGQDPRGLDVRTPLQLAGNAPCNPEREVCND